MCARYLVKRRTAAITRSAIDCAQSVVLKNPTALAEPLSWIPFGPQ